MSGIETAPRGTFGIHYRHPAPWSGIGYDWYEGCRERRPPADLESDAVQAAREDLLLTLSRQPNAFWLAGVAERELHQRYGVGIRDARRLMRECGAMPERGVWCASEVAPLWPVLKDRVSAVLPVDRLMTVEEIEAAVDVEVDVAMVFVALCSLCWDNVAVAIRNPEEDATLFFCRTRRGGAYADYDDLYRARITKGSFSAELEETGRKGT